MDLLLSGKEKNHNLTMFYKQNEIVTAPFFKFRV